ncbi:hypothetical protein D3C72_2126050 [compost metagenome]
MARKVTVAKRTKRTASSVDWLRVLGSKMALMPRPICRAIMWPANWMPLKTQLATKPRVTPMASSAAKAKVRSSGASMAGTGQSRADG